MFAKQVIIALFAFEIIVGIAAQSPATTSNNITVWLDVDNYILENRRQYNATLQNYLSQINDLKDSLEDQLNVLEKEKVLLLDTLLETNEKFTPLESLSFPSKYCVEKYREEFPYSDNLKTGIDACISNARGYANNIVSAPSSYYSSLTYYYRTDFETGLNNCVKQHGNVKTLNYTLCVTTVISKANTYTINNRKNFATSIKASKCNLDNRIDVAVNCLYAYYNPGLTSIGAATRLIDICLNGYLDNKTGNDNNNGTISYGCPNVVYMEFKDAEKETISNQVKSRSISCLEIRFV